MAILKIVNKSDEILRKKSREVTGITPRITTLLDDMKETLIKVGGVGLAAPQVGVLKRICIIMLDPSDEPIELINPEIILAEGEQQELEGCLSCPHEWGVTRRPAKVKVRAVNREGKRVEYEGEDLLARAFCHEIDHLDGKLFLDVCVEMVPESSLREG